MLFSKYDIDHHKIINACKYNAWSCTPKTKFLKNEKGEGRLEGVLTCTCCHPNFKAIE
jgi:hypothetical protein